MSDLFLLSQAQMRRGDRAVFPAVAWDTACR